MAHNKTTFIPEIFKPASKKFVPVAADDPFIHSDVFLECSSLCAKDESGLPNYVLSDPNVHDIIDFSDEVLENITKTQMQREKREREADMLEEKKKIESEAADQRMRKPLDREVERVFKNRAFFVKKTCPVMIPYKSTLSHTEHMTYLRAFVRFRIRPARTPVEAQEYDQYMRLQHKVYEEQSCFNQFSYQVAMLQLATYNSVPDVITAYYNQYVKHRCQRALHYKKHFVYEQQVPICPQDPTKKFNNLSFNHLGHLLSLGSMPLFKIPNPRFSNTLPLDESVARHRPPALSTANSATLTKTPVSEDTNAAYLAQMHQANLVISTSALRVLADNYGPNFDKEWDIPVVVKTFQVKGSIHTYMVEAMVLDLDGQLIRVLFSRGAPVSVTEGVTRLYPELDSPGNDGTESCHRVVFIDKPLPQKTWTPMDQKRLYYKKAALASMTVIKKFPFFRLKSPAMFRYSPQEENRRDARAEESKEPAEYEDDLFNLTTVADNDSFGVPACSETPYTPSKKRKEMVGNRSVKSCKKVKNGKKKDDPVIDESAKDKEEQAKMNKEEGDSSPPKAKDTSNFKATSKGVGEILEKTGTCNESPRKTRVQTDGNKTSPMKASDTKTSSSGIQSGVYKLKESISGDMLENLLGMQDSLLKPSQPGTSTLDSGVEDSTCPVFIPKPWADTLKTDWTNHTQPLTCHLWSGTNLHYQLFSLGLNNVQPGDPNQPLRVIVRHNLHGLSRIQTQKNKSKAYVVYPKPENQAYFGCEVNTLSEITEQWIHLLVRPNTSLMQVRVCESSGEILITEEKDLSTVVKDGKQPHIGFSPIVPLTTLYSVFSTATSLSTGNYLLHHDLNTKAFIMLMRAVESDIPTHLNTLDLHQSYSNISLVTRPYTTPPWLAIDTHILTPFHLKHQKIPATFPMNNPNKKLTNDDRQKINDKAKKKKRLQNASNDKEKGASMTDKRDINSFA